MLPVSSTDSISALAGTAASITCTVFGDLVAADNYKQIGQSTLGTGASTIVAAGSVSLVNLIVFLNTTASPVTGVKVFSNGTAGTNQLTQFAIPANGSVAYDGRLYVYDSTGLLQTSNAVASVTGTAPIVSSGGTLPAISITAASTAAAGSQSAAQFNTVNNLWYDVTNYGVTISNSGATNTANMNTLIQTTAPAGATFFFPQTEANYPFNGAIVVTKNAQTFAGRGDFSSVLFQNSTTDDLFRVSDGIQNVTFKDLGMWVTVTMSSGSAINTGTVSGQGVVGLQVSNCGIQPFGGTWFNGITMNGTRGGEVALIEYCQMNAFTNFGIALVGNTTTPATTSALIVDNTTMNGGITGTTGAVAGIYIQQAGAVNISNSDFISCTNNMLISPLTSVAQVVASVYCENSFFDHSHGSCVKLGGTQPIVRCKFVSCSFTVSNDAATNYAAFEISNTATNPPGDIDLINCSFQNTFNNTGTTNGLLITTGANIKILGNNFNGFTNGIQASPSGAAGVTRLHIIGNTIGPGTITHTASTTGILINAGALAYGLVHISDNTFPATNANQNANTTNITDNSTLGATTAATGQRFVQNNTGLITPPTANYAATAIPLTTVTGVDSRGGIYFPPGVRPCSGRISVYATNAATAQTLTLTVKYGVNNSNADATIFTQAFAAGAAVAGSATFVVDWELLTATTIGVTLKAYNGNNVTNAMIGAIAILPGSLATAAAIVTNVNNWLGVYFSSATAAAITIRSVKYEVQSQ